ncbi:MAG TPA: hypothetical protein VGD99_11775 [Anaerolineae bacterium]
MSRRKTNRSPDKLPQLPETWHVAIHQLRIWVTPPDEAPSRPFIVMVLNLTLGLFQKAQLVSDQPQPDEIRSILQEAMQSPDDEAQKPHRPEVIQIEEATLATALTPDMADIEITVEHEPRPEGVGDIIEDMENHMRGGPPLPGLLSVKGVTPDLVGGLFAAAAEFYRAAPWIHLSDQDSLSLRVASEPQPRFAVVMGNAGVEYGLTMYRQWADYARLFSFADDPLELLPPDGGHSCFFDEISRMPFDDLAAIQRYSWDVAGEQAYPIPIVYTRAGGAERPGRADLIWYEAALRAVPIFVRDHLPSDRPDADRPLKVTLSVPTHAGQVEVELTYPAGTLPAATRPVGMGDWPNLDDNDEDEDDLPAFDRRAMEGVMAMFGSGFDNPDLDEAQTLMYEAWEETNPARRLILAHEALSISPDCTDAYVLLAEEEADTVGRALEYYQQGVAAGERALGQDYFEENVGYFWGLMETRPYMRARQGLANTLWELDRKDEAAAHFQDMLRLNPGDNQGIRYSLLNLLLSTKQDAGAQALLDEYDDGMAEWLYTRALLTFRQEGAGPSANAALKEALRMNKHVPAYLTGRKRVPNRLPPYVGFGDDNEAAVYASGYLPHWRRTPGAIDWLKKHLAPTRASGQKSKSKKPKQGGGKRR